MSGDGLPRDGEGWLRLVVGSMLATWRTLSASNGGERFQRPGVLGVCTPAVPERSVFNSAGYTDPGQFLAVLDEISAWYEERRCAWTVWVPERDGAVAEALAQRGHVLDAAPRAMGAPLAEAERPDLDGIEAGRGPIAEANAINDAAYGYPAGTWGKFNDEGAEELLTYLASVDGRPAATVAAIVHGGDCEIWSVATLPEARGRGLSTALMRLALWEAREAGCATSTLQATKLGRPVYERVGYRDYGALQMWEKRPPELAGSADRRPPA